MKPCAWWGFKFPSAALALTFDDAMSAIAQLPTSPAMLKRAKAGHECNRQPGAGGIAAAPVEFFSKVFQSLNASLIGVGVSCSRRK
jgi:hypothetical protein